MTSQSNLLFLSERSPRHQEWSRASAPATIEVTFLSHSARAAILAQLPTTDYLISERSGQIDAQLIDAAPKLRLIQRLGSLTHDIDLSAARSRAIAVCATPVYGCVLVAEHMLLQMLALAKKLPEVSAIAKAAGAWKPSQRTDENIFAYNWSGRRGVRRITGSTVGILGFGEIGVALARLLTGFRPAQVFYHKRTQLPTAVEQELGLTYAELSQIYTQSDFLCCLLPYSAQTDHSLNADVFASMKQGAFLVQCGSGSVIDEPALAAAIRSGQLGGAALDTYEWEPVRADNPLVAMASTSQYNVLLTPHIANGTGDLPVAHRSGDYENVLRHLNGEELIDRLC